MLIIKNLEAGYGKVQVLHGISIHIPKGQVVTLIGSNGAGKTTTMRAVSGMIKPTAGEISLNGKRVDGMESYTIAKLGLAHSPEGRRVFSTMSVTDNLLLGAFPRLTGSRPKGDVAGDLERAMDLFPRLKERRTQLAGTLSGGEQQMLAMARILRTGASLLLLDEITEGLAPVIVQTLRQLMGQLKQRGFTIILVEQNFHFAADLADRHYVIDRGTIAEMITREQLPASTEKLNHYLGV